MAWVTPDGPLPTSVITRTLKIPNDPKWIANVTGAIYELSLPENWEQVGTLTPEEVADRFRLMFEEFLGS